MRGEKKSPNRDTNLWPEMEIPIAQQTRQKTAQHKKKTQTQE